MKKEFCDSCEEEIHRKEKREYLELKIDDGKNVYTGVYCWRCIYKIRKIIEGLKVVKTGLSKK